MKYVSKGAVVLLAAAFIDVLLALGIRELAPMFSDAGQYAVRLVLMVVFVAGIGLALRTSLRLPRRGALWAGVLGITSAGSVYLFVVAINETKVGNAFVLCYGGGILGSLLLGRMVFGERATVATWAAVLLSLSGLAMFAEALTVLSVGALAAVGSGLLDAVVNALRKTVGGYERRAVMLYSYVTGALAGLVFVAMSTEPVVREVSWWPMLVMVAMVVVGLLLSQMLLYGFSHADLSVGTIISASELFFAAVLGWLAYGETLTAAEAIGGMLIFGAAAFSAVDVPSWWRARRSDNVKAPKSVGLDVDRFHELQVERR